MEGCEATRDEEEQGRTRMRDDEKRQRSEGENIEDGMGWKNKSKRQGTWDKEEKEERK